MELDDAARQRESQAGASGARREERIEDSRFLSRRQTGAVIADREHKRSVVRKDVRFGRLSLPVPLAQGPAHVGTWHARLKIDPERYQEQVRELRAPDAVRRLHSHGVRYSLNVHTTSNLRARAQVSQRSFLPGEDTYQAAPVVILGYGVWQTRYQGDRNVLGRTVRAGSQGDLGPLDLFRYSGAGALDWSTSAKDKYFSVDGGQTSYAGKASFALGKLNGDGRQDLLVQVNNGWRVLYSNGTGFVTGELIVPSWPSGSLAYYYAPIPIDDSRVRIGPVALGGDAFVPIVERFRARFARHLLRPRALARRLVEVPVDDERGPAHRSAAVASTVLMIVRDHRSPRPSRTGQDSNSPLPW